MCSLQRKEHKKSKPGLPWARAAWEAGFALFMLLRVQKAQKEFSGGRVGGRISSFYGILWSLHCKEHKKMLGTKVHKQEQNLSCPEQKSIRRSIILV